MKGLTPVISIILLLMITISMVSFAFIWFNRMSLFMQQKVENATQHQLEQYQIAIENMDSSNGKLFVRNIGTIPVDVKYITVYVNETKLISCSWKSKTGASISTIPPNDVVICENNTIKGCQNIKISTPSMTDVYPCSA